MDPCDEHFWKLLLQPHSPAQSYVPLHWVHLPAGTTIGEAVTQCLDRFVGGPQWPPQTGFTEVSDAVVEADAIIQSALSLRQTLCDQNELSPEQQAESVLRVLGPVGCSRALGCRMTAGTSTALGLGWVPLHVSQLVASFSALHCQGAKLTVGARALAKHVHRDETQSWWGQPLSGSEGQKNALADAVLCRVLHSASWLNIHTLPHGVFAVELRVPEGYGARWTVVDGQASATVAFRGFLEPPDPDGHAHGWIH